MQSLIFWSYRRNYLNLLESFNSKSISSDEFLNQFVQLHQSNLFLAQQLKLDLFVPDQYTQFEQLILSLTAVIEVEISLNYLGLIPSMEEDDFLRIYINNKFIQRVRFYCLGIIDVDFVPEEPLKNIPLRIRIRDGDGE